MAPKMGYDENLVFLYTCLKHSDFTKVCRSTQLTSSTLAIMDSADMSNTQPNINAVAEAFNIKPNAASMRFYRLRQNVDAMIAAADGEKAKDNENGQAGEESKSPAKPKAPKAPRKPKNPDAAKGQGRKRKRVAEEEAQTEAQVDADGNEGDGETGTEVVKAEEEF